MDVKHTAELPQGMQFNRESTGSLRGAEVIALSRREYVAGLFFYPLAFFLAQPVYPEAEPEYHNSRYCQLVFCSAV